MLETIQRIRTLTKQLDYIKESNSSNSPCNEDIIGNLIFKIDSLNNQILQELIDNHEFGFITVDLDSLEEWIKKTEE